ncbi:Cell division protein FtsA [bioreactor metagenome]|uniref:Cell division protein FtsA n=1 Tax=bioreactor metagenome TaxID=1076179 RepID=A0A644T5W7_9ZZZZ|nr:cell division FtsA domain-containing protein [Candidatus Elulimicrobiales bacterium]
MSKAKSHLVIGVDIGSSTTKVCAVLHSEESTINPEIIEIQEVETEGIYKGNIVDEKELANTLHKVINQFRSNAFERKNHIVLSLNTSGISSGITNASIINSSINNEITTLDLDRLEKEAALSVSNIKNKRVIHTIPIKYKVDLSEVSGVPVGMFGKRIDGKFLFVFCPSLYIEKLEDILKGIKLNIEEVVIGPFAESIPLLNKRQRIAGTALINIGHSTTSVLVYENNNPILASVIGIGSNDITNDIALGLQVSLEEAENIKLGRSDASYSKRKLEEIIEARVEFICERINLELDKISRRELLPGGIVLTGNGSKLPKIDYMFKNYMKLPIKYAEEEIRDFSDGQLGDSAYTRAYGLTFLAPIITSDYKVSKIFKNLIKNIKSFFKKLLP